MEREGKRVIVLADDEETWFCLESAWLGYPSEDDWVELEQLGAKPKHLSFEKEPLAPLIELHAVDQAEDDGADAALAAMERTLELQVDRFERYVEGRPPIAASESFEKWAADNDVKDEMHAHLGKVWRIAFAAGRHSVLGDLNPEDER